jgi:hypothetical protein
MFVELVILNIFLFKVFSNDLSYESHEILKIALKIHLTVLIVVWHLVSIILRIIYFMYILIPNDNIYSYISKPFISPTFGDFLKNLKFLCVSIPKNGMTYALS